MLSYELWVVFSRTSAAWASISVCAIDPASLRSLLVMEPVGLANDDTYQRIQSGNRCCDKMRISVVSVGTKCTPPIPEAAASHAPFVAGWRSGMISAIRVGCEFKSFASHRKLLRKPCGVGERRSRFLNSSSCRKASWRMESNPVQPEIAQRHGPELSNDLMPFKPWMWGIELSISRSRVLRCSGRHSFCQLYQLSNQVWSCWWSNTHHLSWDSWWTPAPGKTLCHHRPEV